MAGLAVDAITPNLPPPKKVALPATRKKPEISASWQQLFSGSVRANSFFTSDEKLIFSNFL